MAKIGFVGLGLLGLPMAKNLMKAGHEIKAFDPSDEALQEAEEAGMDPVKSIAEASQGVDVIISMVPKGKRSRAVYLKDDGIFNNADPGTLLIDCSTTYAAPSRDLFDAAEEAGFQMLDAPVSGGVSGAEAGTLTFLVGGDEKAFLEGEAILEVMAGKVFRYGLASGQTPKTTTEVTSKVVYKKNPWWRRSTAILVLLFLGGTAVFFALIEDSIRMNGDKLTLSLELGDTERNLFCRGLGMIGLDIDGC